MSDCKTKKVEFKSEFCDNAFFAEVSSAEEGFVSDFSKYAVFPGFCDVHVHFREPGFSYKETIKSGSMASAKGRGRMRMGLEYRQPCQGDRFLSIGDRERSGCALLPGEAGRAGAAQAGGWLERPFCAG